MIGLLSGTLVRKEEQSAIVDCHGVGYIVAISSLTRERLPVLGGAVVLEIHTHVREDALSLFGFFDAFEKEVFELLLTVVPDLQEQEPHELPDPLGVTIDAHVLAHDVLDRLDRCGERHVSEPHSLHRAHAAGVYSASSSSRTAAR